MLRAHSRRECCKFLQPLLVHQRTSAVACKMGCSGNVRAVCYTVAGKKPLLSACHALLQHCSHKLQQSQKPQALRHGLFLLFFFQCRVTKLHMYPLGVSLMIVFLTHLTYKIPEVEQRTCVGLSILCIYRMVVILVTVHAAPYAGKPDRHM